MHEGNVEEMSKKEKSFSLKNYMNRYSQPEEKDENNIVMVNVHDIDPNPKNFYHIDENEVVTLAATIEIQGGIRMPLELKHSETEGRYIAIAGHRRCLAIQKLLEDKSEKITSPLVPARIRKYETEDEEMQDLIFSNRTQRKRTIEEMDMEVKHLEKLARDLYEKGKENGEVSGRFRKFFAEEILGINESKLQRITSTRKLEPEIRQKVIDGEISKTAATFIASQPKEEQKEIVQLAKVKGGGKVTEKTIKESIGEKKGGNKAQGKKVRSAEKKKAGEIEENIDMVEIKEEDIEIEALDFVKGLVLEKLDDVEDKLIDTEMDEKDDKNKRNLVKILKRKQYYLQKILDMLNLEEKKIG